MPKKQIKKKINNLKQVGGATKDFVKNYRDMRRDGTIDGDKYFHCKANCEASQRGNVGRGTAKALSNTREAFNFIEGDPRSDRLADQEANRYGRVQGSSSNKSCRQLCDRYRVKGINKKY